MKEKEHNIDLRLALGDSTQSAETRLTVNKGVGANAGSRINMAFAASDPLSELIWSPDNGLSLRCADSTLAASKPLLLWNVAPKNLVLSLPENIRTKEDNDHNSCEEGHFVVVESSVNQNLDKEIGLATSSQSKAIPSLNSRNPIEVTSNNKMDPTEDSNVMLHHPEDETNNLLNIITSGTSMDDLNADQVDQRNKHFLIQGISDCEVGLSLSEPSPNKLHDDTTINLRSPVENIAGRCLSSGKDASEAFEVQGSLQCEPVGPLQFISPQQGAEEATPGTEQESENKVCNDDPLIAGASLKRMECSAENDLRNLVRTEALAHTAEELARINSIHLEASPSKSWMELNKKKGKGKVLSDGHDSERFSDDADNSHESVESCNNSGFSAKGKRRMDPSESTIDIKRAKTDPEDNPAFTSPIRPDSSFMNWISNMVKGYHHGPSLDHSVWPKENVRDIVVLGKRSDDMCIGTGFHAMFQSLCSPPSRKPDLRASEPEYAERASEQIILPNNRSGKIPALDYPSGNEKCSQRSLMAKVDTDAATSGNLVLPSQLQIVPVNAAPLQEVRGTNWESFKDGSRFFGCVSKQRNSTPDKSSTDLLSESKTVNNKSVKNSALANLWITRFCPKIESSPLNLNERNQNANRGATDTSRFNCIQVSSEVHSTRNTLGIRENLNEKEGNNLQNDLEALSDNAEESAANKEIPRLNHRNSLHDLDAILPSTICKSPDEIASIFARRLDALKQISLSVTKGGTSSQTATCLFCGKHGHELRYCSDTTESELEALLCNASSHASAVGSSLCIICFQLDHWANTCPKKSASKLIPGRFNSIGNLNVKLGEGYDANLNLAGSKAPPAYAEIDSLVRTGVENFGKRISDGNEVRKRMDSKLGENISERRQYFPICNLVGRKMEAVPEGMLDAIKRLRLSRVEILKCMNSCISLSYLNGFFIRIRVGKLEAGQVGTGYYVASITGEQLELPAKDTKKYIAVNVGGTQSLVGIQYVSNHDFLEDELVTWWCRTLETGAKVPSQGELKSKFEERIKLGFC